MNARKQLPLLDPSEVLAANFKLLAAATPVRQTQLALGEYFEIGAGTVGRIRRKESKVTLATLQAIATAAGLEAWMLLVPMEDAKKRPELVTDEIRQQLEIAAQVTDTVNKTRKPRAA